MNPIQSRDRSFPVVVPILLGVICFCFSLVSLADSKKKDKVAELRAKYPFESISPRLDYESRLDLARLKPRLSESTEKRLAEFGKMASPKFTVFLNLRKRSLERLHSEKAQDFVNRPGFGRARIGFPPSPRYLPEPSDRAFRLVDVKPLGIDKNSTEIVLLPDADVAGGDNRLQLPSQEGMLELHFSSRFNFVSPSSTGYVKDRDHVAGFSSHKFIAMPRMQPPTEKTKIAKLGTLNWFFKQQTLFGLHPYSRQINSKTLAPKPPDEQWLITQLELVSLLKHDDPLVYVMDSLPRMDQIADAKTRILTRFEARGLRKLEDGEDVEIEATINLVHMVGSLRASKTCLQCHSVEHGELLGAFTYVLQRKSPIQ